MATAADINGQGALEEWLKTRTRADHLVLAHRSAMRTLPKCLLDATRLEDFNSMALSIFAANLIASVAARTPSKATTVLIRHRLVDYGGFSNVRRDLNTATDGPSGAEFSNATEDAQRARYVISNVCDLFSSDLSVDVSAQRTAALLSEAWSIPGVDQFRDVVLDAQYLEAGEDVLESPLWQLGSPGGRQLQLNPTRSAIAPYVEFASQPGFQKLDWSFWHIWYDNALQMSRQRQPAQNWVLLEEIAMSVDWSAAPAKQLAQIEEIHLRFAFRATPNGEIISINEATGKLRVDPVQEIDTEYLVEAQKKIASVIDLPAFQKFGNNQYSTLQEELEILRGIDISSSRIFHWHCVVVLARLKNKALNEVCPSPDKDANVEHLMNTVMEVISDLTTYDPQVRDAVKARAAMQYESDPARDEIIAVANEKIAEMSEEDLAEQSAKLADTLRDPNAPAGEKAEARYMTASRFIRALFVKGYAKLISIADEVVEWCDRGAKISTSVLKMGAAVSSPLWLEPAYKAILTLFL